MTPLRLTILVENTASGRGLQAEHGLSLWIERGSRRVLFDAGQTDLLCRNADRLRIDLGTADALVLSHGHYDHTGGLSAALEKTRPGVQVFAHPAVMDARYAKNPDGTAREIGMPASSRTALEKRALLERVDSPRDIGHGLWVTGPVPRDTTFEDTGGPFYTDEACRQPDTLPDDQAAFADTPEGLAVILGCAHAGVINTLRYIQNIFPRRPVYAVWGGMHLGAASVERMNQTVAALRKMDVRKLFPIHCTGFPAAARLWKEFPGRVAACPVGTTVELGGGGSRK